MANRRRNLIILVLVLALLAGSSWVISDKRTVLGLDLRGGTELVYQGRATPQVPEVTPEDIDRAIEIIRERVDTLGVAEPEITRIGADQIEVGLPDVQDSDRAIDRIGTTAQLYFYDFEPNVIPPNPDVSDPEERPYNRLIDAVEAASERKPECFQNTCTTNGPTHYLFDEDTLEPLGEPSENLKDLYLPFGGEKPPNSRVIDVPQGTVVLEEPPTDDASTQDVDESTLGDSQFFVLKDRPSLSGDEIESPEQNLDPVTNQPNVTFDFTDEGQQAFQQVTRDISLRGQDAYFAATGQPASTADEATAAEFSDSFAIVLDGELQSRPIINFKENPDGIDGRTGAQISGNFTTTEAQDLAEVLRIGALPIKLALISQSQVSATLGEQALDEGLKAGLAGLAVVLLFLIAYYRFLGARRRARAARLRGLLPRPDQADPDHPDAAGDRRPDPDDRRRGGLQHRHLRTNKGGDQGRADRCSRRSQRATRRGSRRSSTRT